MRYSAACLEPARGLRDVETRARSQERPHAPWHQPAGADEPAQPLRESDGRPSAVQATLYYASRLLGRHQQRQCANVIFDLRRLDVTRIDERHAHVVRCQPFAQGFAVGHKSGFAGAISGRVRQRVHRGERSHDGMRPRRRARNIGRAAAIVSTAPSRLVRQDLRGLLDCLRLRLAVAIEDASVDDQQIDRMLSVEPLDPTCDIAGPSVTSGVPIKTLA